MWSRLFSEFGPGSATLGSPVNLLEYKWFRYAKLKSHWTKFPDLCVNYSLRNILYYILKIYVHRIPSILSWTTLSKILWFNLNQHLSTLYLFNNYFTNRTIWIACYIEKLLPRIVNFKCWSRIITNRYWMSISFTYNFQNN